MRHGPQSASRRAPGWLMIFSLTCCFVATARAEDREPSVHVMPNEAARRVDVFVNGLPFTSYIFPHALKKPVLFPLRTARGTVVTRGFPLEPQSGERVDHPHQVGLWFNHGDVNGVDFWNNSTVRSPMEASKMGTIFHRKVIRAKDGPDRGELDVTMDWVMPDGKTVLREDTKFVFHAAPDMRAVDRVTRLTARHTRIVFKDNKEGVFALRVARSLEKPSTKAEVFTDASGKPTVVPVVDNTGVNGRYLSSEGLKGDDVWGTRGRWVALTGKIGKRWDEPVTLVILDHPKNPGYPTYWHARGYGLFAANPLGQKVFSNGTEELNLTLAPKTSVTFRHRLLILSRIATAEEVEAQHRRFVAEIE